MLFDSYKRLSVRLFGGIAEGFKDSFKSIAPQLRGAGIHMLLKTYIAVILMTTVVVYLAALGVIIALITPMQTTSSEPFFKPE